MTIAILLCWPLVSIITAFAFCRALGAADMREQALDQRSDADGTGFPGFPNNHDGSACK